LALALMAKGVVALLLFVVVVGAFMLPTLLGTGGLAATLRAWLRPGAVLIFFLVAAPWHIAASMAEPIFPWFYFINEHVLRFLGKREPHDYYAGAWWYYLPRMLLYLFPWSLLLVGLIQRRSGHGQDAGGDETRQLSRFLFLAWSLPLLFFSVSSAKANYYLVVVMPFAAFQLALALEQRDFLEPRWRMAPGLLLALITGAAALFLILRGAHLAAEPSILGFSQLQFAIGSLIVLCVSGLAAGATAGWSSRVGVTSYLLPAALCATALLVAINAVEPLVSNRLLAQYMQHDLAGRPVYLYRNFEELSSLPFYLGQPVHVIDSRSNDLYWGNKLQPNTLLIDGATFAQAATDHPVAVVVMQRQMEEFRATPYFGRFKGQNHIGTNTVFYN